MYFLNKIGTMIPKSLLLSLAGSISINSSSRAIAFWYSDSLAIKLSFIIDIGFLTLIFSQFYSSHLDALSSSLNHF